MPHRKKKIAHERLVLPQVLLGGFPAVATVLCILWLGDGWDPKHQWTLTLVIVGCWLGFALAVQNRVVRPLQTMANLLSALREGDFSVRARGARRDEPLGDVMSEINMLSRTLQEQRLSALEATALLRKPAERILGREAAEIGLGECLTGEPARLLTTTFASGGGRWGMRRSLFREGGRPHHLIVIGDLSRTLREEETRAWQRLVRVLGHELNNSLAPIKSLAGSLASLLRRAPRPSDWEDDMRSGLDIIENRADGLSRFMQAYARLARLPVPTLAPCEVPALVQRVTALEARLPVTVLGGPPLEISCDAAQVEQVLINLLKNAVEAAQETGGGVRIGWKKTATQVEIAVEDDGPGLANTANLFVPFFTTKSEGSGIGLVLCRQIAENHRGSLTLTNREGASGCIALLKLPA